jgi:protein-S-isoprenylcysteine O-methyltransferase Ste14
MRTNLITVALVLGAVAWLLVSQPHAPMTPMRIAGVAIGLPALLLLAVARIQLGRAFTLQARATTLVTTGLYSRIRNPIYTFGMLAIAGGALYLERPWLLLLLLVIAPVQFFRSRKEAAVLAEKFGDAYQSYKSQTWF